MCGQKEKRKTHFTEISSSCYLAMPVLLLSVLKNTRHLWGLFYYHGDLNLKKARTVKRNSPVDCFAGSWYETGTVSLQNGRRVRQMRSICVPLPAPIKQPPHLWGLFYYQRDLNLLARTITCRHKNTAEPAVSFRDILFFLYRTFTVINYNTCNCNQQLRQMSHQSTV